MFLPRYLSNRWRFLLGNTRWHSDVSELYVARLTYLLYGGILHCQVNSKSSFGSSTDPAIRSASIILGNPFLQSQVSLCGGRKWSVEEDGKDDGKNLMDKMRITPVIWSHQTAWRDQIHMSCHLDWSDKKSQILEIIVQEEPFLKNLER